VQRFIAYYIFYSDKMGEQSHSKTFLDLLKLSGAYY